MHIEFRLIEQNCKSIICHISCRFIKNIDLLDGIDQDSDTPPVLCTPQRVSRIKLVVKTPTSGPSSPTLTNGFEGLQVNKYAIVSCFGSRSCIYILDGIVNSPLIDQRFSSSLREKTSSLRFEFDELSSPTRLLVIDIYISRAEKTILH